MTEKFNFNDVEDFDKHIAMSIPNYDTLHKQVVSYIECFAQPNTTVLDLGCSTGKLLNTVSRDGDIAYVGIDNSSLNQQQDFDVNTPLFFNMSAEDYNWGIENSYSVITSIFFLQFLPRKLRSEILQKIFDNLIDGGCFICAEKTHFRNPRLESVTLSEHLQEKNENFDSDEILKKMHELSRSMWLSTEDEMIKELSIIGEPSVFWKSYNFTGYIVFKGMA